MITTIIIGKRSYISSNLKKNFSNSHVFSTKEISRVNKLINKEKTINIIYNHSFPISKLNTTEDYSAIIDKNIISFNNFINYILKKKIKIKTFILSSSSSVYGINFNDKNINRYDNNKSIYAASKYLMEKMLISHKKNLKCKVIISRIFNIYGPKEKNSLITKIINFKKNKKKFKIFSKKDSYRDFIHIDDLIMIYKFFIEKNLSGIYDVGSGKSINVKKLILRYFKKKEIEFISKNKFIDEIQFSKAKIKYLKPIKNKLVSLNPFKYIDNCLFEEK